MDPSLDALTSACRGLMVVPSGLPHRLLKSLRTLNNNQGYGTTADYASAVLLDANLVSSALEGDGMHAPVLDLDFPCALVPSSTPGHYHLYLDKVMPWDEYGQLLWALRAAGVLQSGFVAAAISREQTMVRLPWVRKS